MVSRQLAIKAGSAGAAAVVGYAIDGRVLGVKSFGEAGIASDQVDENFVAVGFADSGDDALEEASRSTFYQQNSGDLGLAYCKEIPHCNNQYNACGQRRPRADAWAVSQENTIKANSYLSV